MPKNRCSICNGDIESEILYKGDYDQINASAIWPGGENLDLDGHKTCLENVNRLVVIQNRLRVQNLFIENLTYKAHEEKRNKITKTAIIIYTIINAIFLMSFTLLTIIYKTEIWIWLAQLQQGGLIFLSIIISAFLNTWLIIFYNKDKK